MIIETETVGRATVFRIIRRLNMSTCPLLKQAAAFLSPKIQLMVDDLSDMEFVAPPVSEHCYSLKLFRRGSGDLRIAALRPQPPRFWARRTAIAL